jgi:DNA-binding CsgD family transcriptional regulator
VPDPSKAHRAALELSYQVDGAIDRDEYLRATAETLLRVIGGDTVLWKAIRLRQPTVEVVVHPGGRHDAGVLGQQLTEVLGEHPMIPPLMAERRPDDVPAPRRLSDVATRTELSSNRAYVEVLRPWGARYQLTALASPISLESTRAWSISRSTRDFSDRAVELAEALQPVLVLLDRTFAGSSFQPDPAAHERANLTAREVEILQLVASGLTSQAIGRRLRISARTVDKHRESLHRKLGSHDRLSVVRRAQELGLVPVPRRGRSPAGE